MSARPDSIDAYLATVRADRGAPDSGHQLAGQAPRALAREKGGASERPTPLAGPRAIAQVLGQTVGEDRGELREAAMERRLASRVPLHQRPLARVHGADAVQH